MKGHTALVQCLGVALHSATSTPSPTTSAEEIDSSHHRPNESNHLLLVSGSIDNTLRVWDAEVIYSFPPSLPIQSLIYSDLFEIESDLLFSLSSLPFPFSHFHYL